MHMTQRKKTGPTGPLCYAEEGEGKKLKSGRTENAPRCCGRKESGGGKPRLSDDEDEG